MNSTSMLQLVKGKGQNKGKKKTLTSALYKKPTIYGILASPLLQSHTVHFSIPCRSFAPRKPWSAHTSIWKKKMESTELEIFLEKRLRWICVNQYMTNNNKSMTGTIWLLTETFLAPQEGRGREPWALGEGSSSNTRTTSRSFSHSVLHPTSW